MPRVYVTRPLPPSILRPLDGYDIRIWDGDGPVPPNVLADEVSDATGVLTMLTDRIDETLLEGTTELRVVSQMAVGVDNIDLDACRRHRIAVGHTPEVLTETVADSAFALLGAIVRRLPEGAEEVKAGEWGPWAPFHLTGGDLHGTVLGIVGMGRIGSAVALRAVGFDMEVVYTSRSVGAPRYTQVTLGELLARADHVVVTTELNPETTGLFGRSEFAAMKSTAYLVNVSRGPVVDTDALFEALSSGQIAGAALDVTDPEPLPADHPLLTLPNCLVVPHIASASVRTREAMAALAVDNLVAGVEGRPLPHAVLNGI